MKQCLIFIQIAARAFLHVPDAKLVHLGNVDEAYPHTPTADDKNEANGDPVQVFERETSLPNRIKQVREGLGLLEGEIDKQEYNALLKLIKMINVACIALK
jgi:hypothetical protein